MMVLSIQSQVVFGCAGNSAAVPVLQARGHEVLAVPTALLSNTPYYPRSEGGSLPADLVRRLLEGALERIPHGGVAAVITGWMGSAETVEAVADLLAQFRRAHPGALYLCDPVMGDTDFGFYAEPATARAIAERLVPCADILTPNVFEQTYLAQQGVRPRAGCLRATTGVETSPGRIGVSLACDGRTWTTDTPRLANNATGTGDVFSAVFLAERLAGHDAASSLEVAVSTVHLLVDDANRRGLRELPIADHLAAIAARPRASTAASQSGETEGSRRRRALQGRVEPSPVS